MKKILLLLVGIFLFANELDIVNKKLDLILKELQEIKKSLKIKDREINTLKRKIKINNCDGLKIKDFKYKYEKAPFISFYRLSFKIKNEYPETITKIEGNLYVKSEDGSIILKDYIDRKITIKPNESVEIIKNHAIKSTLEEVLKEKNPKDLKVYFVITHLNFTNKELKCGF